MKTILTSEQETQRAALASIAAALVLTALKLGSGLASNSLGLLSEAAHSGLDLIAALLTYAAVRISARPPDSSHPYGHGKIENLSALAQTLLLLVTCGWIVREAVERLFFSSPSVEPSLWGIAVMLISIGVDYSRARLLTRVARLHKSQALEADALHFSTDIWSSVVVLIGLILIMVSSHLPPDMPLAGWLHKTDALAGLIVVALVVRASLRLGREAVNILMDGYSGHVDAAIEAAVLGVPGVKRISRLRVRESGANIYVDMTLILPGNISFDAAHAISRSAEEAVRLAAPRADVTVHFEPETTPAPKNNDNAPV